MKNELNKFYGEPLINQDKFAELIITSIGYGKAKDREAITTFEIPADFIDRLNCYFEGEFNEVNRFRDLTKLVDVDLYFNNRDFWNETFNEAIKRFFMDNRNFKASMDPDTDDVIVSCPTYKLSQKLEQFPRELINPASQIASFIENEDDLEYVDINDNNNKTHDTTLKGYIKKIFNF